MIANISEVQSSLNYSYLSCANLRYAASVARETCLIVTVTICILGKVKTGKTKQLDYLLGDQFRNKIVNSDGGGVREIGGPHPAAVEVGAQQVRALVAQEHPIWVKHRDHLPSKQGDSYKTCAQFVTSENTSGLYVYVLSLPGSGVSADIFKEMWYKFIPK